MGRLPDSVIAEYSQTAAPGQRVIASEADKEAGMIRT